MDNTLITQDRLDELVRLCKLTKANFIAEVGVYKGGSLKVLSENFPSAMIYGFDTFEGLPGEQWNENEIHKPGEFSDTRLETVYNFIRSENVILQKGLFPISGKDYQDYKFDFVHIDTDFYKAVKESLYWFWPRMNKEGIIVFDDYDWPNCPGVKKALDESGLKYKKTDAKYQAYLIKE